MLRDLRSGKAGVCRRRGIDHGVVCRAGHVSTTSSYCVSMEWLLAAHLCQRMSEDMQVRNFALNTELSYLQQVSLFARHFGPGLVRATGY
ncbi:hypothetical protein GCM10007880_58410 [Mesorhizobium amorphae]|nr:hypothetical protein GCM10007880_58410 [Mesorhizobium amorphae]